jgi:glycosyltransferase involved in cell wall biosynthesis
MKKGLISVVIATRNRFSFLTEAIASVRRQSAKDFELIVVDDASEDETSRVAEIFDGKGERFFRLEKHGERSTARNFGLTQSHGEFIMFLDDDDLLRKDALKLLRAALLENKDAIAAVGAQRTYTTEGYSARIFHPRKTVKKEIWRELVAGWGAVSGQNLYRTEAITKIGGFNEKVLPFEFIPCEDRELWLKVSKLGKVCLIPQTVLEYRLHSGQTGKVPNIKEIREKVFAHFIETLSTQEKKVAERIRVAARLAEEAGESRLRGEFPKARQLFFRAFRAMPELWFSPLLKTAFYYGVKDAVWQKTD